MLEGVRHKNCAGNWLGGAILSLQHETIAPWNRTRGKQKGRNCALPVFNNPLGQRERC
jgi:hypothetical protein